MRAMKNYRKFLIAAVVCLLLPTGAAFGQPADKDTRKVVFSGGTDIVSSYVWRGVYEMGPALEGGMIPSRASRIGFGAS